MTERKVIGVQRTADDGSIDQRCTNCVDFSASADPIYAGQPLDCTYCGQQWASKSELRNELDALERRYMAQAISWAAYKEGMRDLYRRATAAGDDTARVIAEWADDMYASCEGEFPYILDGALAGLPMFYVIEHKVNGDGEYAEIARGEVPAHGDYDALSDAAYSGAYAVAKVADKRDRVFRWGWMNPNDEDNRKAEQQADRAGMRDKFGALWLDARDEIQFALEDRTARYFSLGYRIRLTYVAA